MDEQIKPKQELWFFIKTLQLYNLNSLAPWFRILFFNSFLFTVVVIAYSQVFSYYEDTPSIWFQRSGSIIVITAIILELKHKNKMNLLYSFTQKLIIDNLKVDLEPSNKPYYSLSADNEMREIIKPYDTLVEINLIVWAIIGTMIWGYGDIIYKLFNSI
ncbi:hypothetical protein GCM10008107_25330 [Psychrosphaera saromensis]|uniref:Uncharacterized protein n=1 Tax=Psychrosphaera saromensis TaxID=716813 RepID=A0A2S7UW93_9GAMM|nr:hypothetical protein [Psychrosphaera saromensis]PQJ54254.1 hypothetical protein BTO11_11710 [Psychrosphaera saromensis]GHB74758.1 hypothetical protein GCM10008107_25330 [Psychrosphaera saromensis]GLQ12646.1 hypothetical protein GCM10007917_01010 [Psychrosphaera saromensis]